MAPLAISLGLYSAGWWRMRRRLGPRLAPRWQALSFYAGCASIFVALVSPLSALSDALFSAHMAEHEILMLVAAPLFAYSRPLLPFLWGLPLAWRRAAGRAARPFHRVWRTLTEPRSAWVLHGGTVWLWHAPVLYDAAVAHEWIHAAQHLCFLGSALLFWWALFCRRQSGLHLGAAVLYVFTTAAHESLLGALLTFSTSVWYPIYAGRTLAWHLTALQDQQLGGLIMWIPAGTLFTVVGLLLMAAWLRQIEQRRPELAPRAAAGGRR